MTTVNAYMIDLMWQALEDDPRSHCDTTELFKDLSFPWIRLLVLADAYEEVGEDNKARVLRWCVRWKKRPWWMSTDYTGPIYPIQLNWFTNMRLLMSIGTRRQKSADPSSDLPNAVFSKLPHHKQKGGDDMWVQYESLREAFLALVDAISVETP